MPVRPCKALSLSLRVPMLISTKMAVSTIPTLMTACLFSTPLKVAETVAGSAAHSFNLSASSASGHLVKSFNSSSTSATKNISAPTSPTMYTIMTTDCFCFVKTAIIRARTVLDRTKINAPIVARTTFAAQSRTESPIWEHVLAQITLPIRMASVSSVV
jgi:hypothetical protein